MCDKIYWIVSSNLPHHINLKLCPEATVIPIWKTAICKRGILKHPVFNVLNFRGWIKSIFDTVD